MTSLPTDVTAGSERVVSTATGGGRVWRDSQAIPHITACESVDQYDADQIHGEIERLAGAGTWNTLFAAARAWSAAGDKLDGLRQQLSAAAQTLAGAWSSDDAVACQQALQRIHTTAGNVADSARGVYRFTDASAASLQQAVGSFPGRDSGSGLFETAGRAAGGSSLVGGSVLDDVGGFIGGGMDSLFGTGEDPNEKPRQALADLNARYQSDNTRLPEQVSAELPVIGEGGTGKTKIEELGGGSFGGGPSAGMPGGVPGAGGFDPSTVGSGPSGGGTTGAFSPGGSGGLPGAGVPGGPGGGDFPAGPSDGGLNSAGPLGPGGGLPGAGGGAGMPGGGGGGMPGGGGIGGGLGGAAGGVGMVPGGAAGGRGAGAGSGRGLGAGGGRGMAGGMVPMGGAGAGGTRGGRGAGGAGAGGGRPGLTGGKIAGGGAAGGAGRGVGGGMMPMGAGRGGGEEHERDTWLVEDDDPWGADSDTPPGVIR
jgi:hypothetical protein